MNKLALAVAISASTVALAYVVIGAVTATLGHDDFGKVPIPGQGVVELESGTVGVFYQERNASLGENESIDPPGDLTIVVNRRGDAPVELEDEGGGSSYELGSSAGTQIGKIDVPEDGPYTVVTTGGGGRDRPEVTFGEEVPLGTLLGRAALIIIAGLGVGALLWRIGSATRKRTPLEPASAAASAAARVAAPAPAPTTAPGPEDALRRLEARKAAGELSEAEYAAERAEVLRKL